MSSTLAPSYMSPNAGEGICGVSANEYSCVHGAQINFGDLTPYLTYDPICWQGEFWFGVCPVYGFYIFGEKNADITELEEGAE
jgi:hypothetical protein